MGWNSFKLLKNIEEFSRHMAKTNNKITSFFKQRKYLFALSLVPFLILFFITQDHGHEGTLKGKDYHYTGKILNDHPEGQGTMTYTNGNVYSGHFKAGAFDGAGTFKNPKAKWTYTGEFKNAKPDGAGKFTLSDGKTKKVNFEMGVLVK